MQKANPLANCSKSLPVIKFQKNRNVIVKIKVGRLCHKKLTVTNNLQSTSKIC